jgi:hypothetical protein
MYEQIVLCFFYWYIIVDYHDWYVVPVLLHDLYVPSSHAGKWPQPVYCHGDTVPGGLLISAGSIDLQKQNALFSHW